MRDFQRGQTQLHGVPWGAGLLSFALLLSCNGCATSILSPTPPITFSFPVHKAGARIETELRIVEERSYRFHINFMFSTPEERKRVSELVGVNSPTSYHDRDGRLIQQTHGVVVPVRLTVHAIDTAGGLKVLNDERYETEGRNGFTASYFSRLFATIRLSPGLYRVTVQTLRDVPEFEGIDSKFNISWRQP
jgi:hypothetical protein